MKQGKPLTRAQKEVLSAQGLNWKEYSFLEEWETKLIVYHKPTGSKKVVDKKKRGKTWQTS